MNLANSTHALDIPKLPSAWSRADYLGMLKVRLGFDRNNYRVEPGLYRIGEPTPASPVLVTCNYKLTVDVVRRDLAGVDAWLLVVDTRGVNVWCAAGKGTFSSTEVAKRTITSGLVDHVEHETLVLPQLSATGVAAHEVRRMCGYRVVFGPVRSNDIPAFLAAGMKATPEMRAVTFTLAERLILAPVEFVGAFRGWRWLVPLGIALASGLGPGVWSLDALTARAPLALAAYLAGIVAGTFGNAALLPWLPGRALGLKGAEIGALAGLLVALAFGATPLEVTAAVLLSASLSAYLAVNFTGSTPYTSPSGVEKELRAGLPWMVAAASASAVLWIASAFVG